MSLSEHISILTVGQDNLFAGLPNCRVDHVRTGRSIVPMCAAEGGERSSWWPRVLSRIFRGSYDLIVLPVVDFRWHADGSRMKRAIRRIAAGVLPRRPFAGPVNRLLARRNTTVVALDRYDTSETFDDFLNCLTSARRYFKANLREADRERLQRFGPGRECSFKLLPYWIATDKYQVPFRAAKDIDIFFAGDVNSEERRAALAMVRRLNDEGYRVKILEEKVPFAEYLELMSRSWLTLSPAGCGYNGFRHYEAMAVGSVPVINLPNPAIVSDFVHGKNCLLYSQAEGDLLPLIRSAMADRERLSSLAQTLPKFVVEHHSRLAVGRYLLRESLAHADDSPIRSAAMACSRFESDRNEAAERASETEPALVAAGQEDLR